MMRSTVSRSMTTVIGIFGFLLQLQAQARPAQVLLFRHAEKPSSGDELSPRGFQRAAALVGLLTKNPKFTEYGLPVGIYAAAPDHKTSSVRSIETVQPLAKALGLEVNTDFLTADIDSMVNEVMTSPKYNGKTVVVCWAHNYLSEIAHAFEITPQPADWDSAVFDRIWKIDFNSEGASLTDLPEKLLPGDSAH